MITSTSAAQAPCSKSQPVLEVLSRTAVPGDTITVIVWNVRLASIDSVHFGTNWAASWNIDGTGIQSQTQQPYTRILIEVGTQVGYESNSLTIVGHDLQGVQRTIENPVAPRIPGFFELQVGAAQVDENESFLVVVWGARLATVDAVQVAGNDAPQHAIDGSGISNGRAYTRLRITSPSGPFVKKSRQGVRVQGTYQTAFSTLYVDVKNDRAPRVVTSAWRAIAGISPSTTPEVFDAQGLTTLIYQDSVPQIRYAQQSSAGSWQDGVLVASAGSARPVLASASGTHRLFGHAPNNRTLVMHGLTSTGLSVSQSRTIHPLTNQNFAAGFASGALFVAYIEYGSSRLYLARCSGNHFSCTLQTSLVSNNAAGRPDLITTPNGDMLIVFRTTSGTLGVARYDSATGSLQAPQHSGQLQELDYDPSGLIQPDGAALVFAVGADGNLRRVLIELNPLVLPASLETINSDTTGIKDGSLGDLFGPVRLTIADQRVGVFVSDSDELLWSIWQKSANSPRLSRWTSQCASIEGPPALEQKQGVLSLFGAMNQTLQRRSCDAHCLGEAPKTLFIPGYHGIASWPSAIPTANFKASNYILESTFEDHLDYLQRQGFQTVNTNELNHLCTVHRPVIITIDDGLTSPTAPAAGSGIHLAEQQLAARGMVGSAFIIGGRTANPYFVNETQIQGGIARGVLDIQNHTWSHQCNEAAPGSGCLGLTAPGVSVQMEVDDTSALISSLGGAPIALTFPFNARNAQVESIVSARLPYAMMNNALVGSPDKPWLHRMGVNRWQMARVPVSLCTDVPDLASTIRLCEHSEYDASTGVPLDIDCGGGCARAVCDVDSSCCTTQWSSACVALARSSCDIDH